MSLPPKEPLSVEVDLNTFSEYPGVESSVLAFAKEDIEYLGDIKLFCCPFCIN